MGTIHWVFTSTCNKSTRHQCYKSQSLAGHRPLSKPKHKTCTIIANCQLKYFPVWLRNRLLSAGLEPVLSDPLPKNRRIRILQIIKNCKFSLWLGSTDPFPPFTNTLKKRNIIKIWTQIEHINSLNFYYIGMQDKTWKFCWTRKPFLMDREFLAELLWSCYYIIIFEIGW